MNSGRDGGKVQCLRVMFNGLTGELGVGNDLGNVLTFEEDELNSNTPRAAGVTTGEARMPRVCREQGWVARSRVMTLSSVEVVATVVKSQGFAEVLERLGIRDDLLRGRRTDG